MPSLGAAKRETSSATPSRKAPPAQAAPQQRKAAPPFIGHDQEVLARRQQINAVADSLNQTGNPPPGVRRGGLPGKPGVYGNKSGKLPLEAEGYYRESDVWPGPGKRGAERIVTGGRGEVWYSPDHYETFLEWFW